MLNSSLLQKDKSLQTQHLISTLQAQRSAVWAMYCKIAEMQASFADREKISPMLSSFSQLLIDYISLGHFGIYEKLMARKQQPLAALSYAIKLYPAFSNTTAVAILFNDAYVGSKRNWHTENLVSNLSKLGEHLAKRMEIEDWLCRLL